MRYELGKVVVRKRNRLPHWDAEHAIYFVTFSLADSLPDRVRRHMRLEAEAQIAHLRATGGNVTIAERKAIEAHASFRLGNELDRGYGSCSLGEQRAAAIVADALTHFDEVKYRLLAWCVMPNHVHVVLDSCTGVAAVVHSWKSFTANRVMRS